MIDQCTRSSPEDLQTYGGGNSIGNKNGMRFARLCSWGLYSMMMAQNEMLWTTFVSIAHWSLFVHFWLREYVVSQRVSGWAENSLYEPSIDCARVETIIVFVLYGLFPQMTTISARPYGCVRHRFHCQFAPVYVYFLPLNRRKLSPRLLCSEAGGIPGWDSVPSFP